MKKNFIFALIVSLFVLGSSVASANTDAWQPLNGEGALSAVEDGLKVSVPSGIKVGIHGYQEKLTYEGLHVEFTIDPANAFHWQEGYDLWYTISLTQANQSFTNAANNQSLALLFRPLNNESIYVDVLRSMSANLGPFVLDINPFQKMHVQFKEQRLFINGEEAIAGENPVNLMSFDNIFADGEVYLQFGAARNKEDFDGAITLHSINGESVLPSSTPAANPKTSDTNMLVYFILVLLMSVVIIFVARTKRKEMI
jgi:hypothetical protein